ncbi:hypothetical protein [Vibrio ouci]|uniref:Uncharacterized protein n=1 Tax=Vibrio ouci TaxID=2499078 RepID=A0A4Y8WB17_9VIBR|nr:hypothetical protein [Vibrio ouci]TFH90140.1 hypothetical protein ELS82_18400 [Vibrio ouci]
MNRYHKAGIWLCLLMVIAIMISQRNVSPNFSFPKCEIDTPAEMSITFYVDADIKRKSELKGKLTKAIQLSNEILGNSCVSLTRKIEEIQYIEISRDLESAASLHKELETIVGKDEIAVLRGSPLHQYVLILNENHSFTANEEIYGITMMNINDSFVILDENFPLVVLEHELGHLGWAMHDRKESDDAEFWISEQVFPENRYKVKPYAGGFFCSGYGTVMTYSEKIIPAYSSPEITNNGEACGKEGFADNARVMREYALSLR